MKFPINIVIFKKLSEKLFSDKRYMFLEIGFHGDKYLIQFVSQLISTCTHFIETGTNVGSTLAYVARSYPQIICFSCEPDPTAFTYAQINTERLKNVQIFNETSQEFLARISTSMSDLYNKQVVFWLDAHGYGFEWPLRAEIAFITSNFQSPFIFIDDFKVPGEEQFGYDEYENQICSFAYIQDSINPSLDIDIYYPAHKEKTSKYHPLRGWGLITYGTNMPLLPAELQRNIRKARLR